MEYIISGDKVNMDNIQHEILNKFKNSYLFEEISKYYGHIFENVFQD